MQPLHRFWQNASIICIFLGFYSMAQSIAIDNDVMGDPIIECGETSIGFAVTTKKLFAGRIYIKGKAMESACVRSDFADLSTSAPAFDLTFGTCGMRGQRAEEPRGMFYEATYIVSFHPLFVTKVDRAYRVKCFFEEALRTMTIGFDVGMVSTADVTAYRSITGTCTYTIHQGTINAGTSNLGPPISVAQVGDKIVHRWECTDGMYGLLVRSCYVTDGFGTQAEVIDKRGCPVDPILITTISYDASLTQAYAESHVFKFADRPGVWFFCQIQMCLKMSQACEGLTPPACNMIPSGGSNQTMSPLYNRTTQVTPSRPRNVSAAVDTDLDSETKPESTNNPIDTAGTAVTYSGLSPAPFWSSTEEDSVASAGASGSSSSGATTSTVSPGHGKSGVRVVKQRGEEEAFSVTTADAIYEDEQAESEDDGREKKKLGEENGTLDNLTSQPTTARDMLEYETEEEEEVFEARSTSNSVSTDASVTTESLKKSSPKVKKLRRPAPTRRSGRRSSGTTTVSRTFKKRAGISAFSEEDVENADAKRKNTSRSNRKMRPKQNGASAKVAPMHVEQEFTETDADPTQNEDTFLYTNSELSNRLIIFDADEEPPSDLLRSPRILKKPDVGTLEHNYEEHNASAPRHAGAIPSGDFSRPATTSKSMDGCVVSTQGLIMIVTGFASLSALLLIVLIVMCVKYRPANRVDRRKTLSLTTGQQNRSANLENGMIINDRHRSRSDRFNKIFSQQHSQQPKHQRSCSSSSYADFELPKLPPRPPERRKQR